MTRILICYLARFLWRFVAFLCRFSGLKQTGLLRFAAPLFVMLVQPTSAQSDLPTLKITGDSESLTVSWPVSAYYYVLETKTNLDASTPWRNLATGAKVVALLPFPTRHPSGAVLTTNILDGEIAFTLPLTNEQQFFRLEGANLIPTFSFAAFYDGVMEFSSSPTMVFNGPVHANGPIYFGSSSMLYFNEIVTAGGEISSPINNGYAPPQFPENITFNNSPPYLTNVSVLKLWTGTDNHLMIELPPPGENPSTEPGWLRLCNQAQIVLTVSNTSVTAKIQTSPALATLPGSDPSPILLKISWTNGSSPATIQANLKTNGFNFFLSLTNIFYDQRENKSNLVTQIDVAKYGLWIKTNSAVQDKFPYSAGVYPILLYVADNRTTTPHQMSVVRLTNGIAPPVNGGYGWGLATRNPLYIWGNYNCTNLAHLGTTNTTTSLPCALIADAVTILSSAWTDNVSFTKSSTGPLATSLATINAGIVTGNVPSTGSASGQFSGGVHNLPRLLENWSGSHLWLNTSLVRLYSSTIATNQFRTAGADSYHVPPTRHFNFDRNFLNVFRSPPGSPWVQTFAPSN